MLKCLSGTQANSISFSKFQHRLLPSFQLLPSAGLPECFHIWTQAVSFCSLTTGVFHWLMEPPMFMELVLETGGQLTKHGSRPSRKLPATVGLSCSVSLDRMPDHLVLMHCLAFPLLFSWLLLTRQINRSLVPSGSMPLYLLSWI